MGLFNIEIGLLQQPQQDVLHVFPHIAGLGEGGGIGHREGHVEQLCQGLGQQGLAAAGGSDQQDVRLMQPGGCLAAFAIAVPLPGEPFVVVVNGHRQTFLGLLLAHHLTVEEGLDRPGGGDVGQGGGWLRALLGRGLVPIRLRGCTAARGALHQLLVEDLVAEVYALVADIDARTSDQLAHLLLRLAAEGTFQVGVELGHRQRKQGTPMTRISTKTGFATNP